MWGVDARLHPDEALFAAQARLIPADPLLRTTDLDKPPLTFYATALSFAAFGPTEWAARLPNLFASILSLAVLYRLVRALYAQHAVALIALLLWACAPYDLAFAATVFTDVQATLWVLVACLLAITDRWRGAGIAAALLFASKPTALLFLPLIAALGIAHQAKPGWNARDMLRRLWALAWPLGVGLALLVLWDQARAPRSFFELGYTRNDPGRLIRSDEVWPRLEAWGHWLRFVTGAPLANALLALAGGWGLACGLRGNPTRRALQDWLIAGFALAFLAWHWLVAFNTYDRYLHTLVPLLLILAARGLALTLNPSPKWRGGRGVRASILALIMTITLPSIAQTLRGEAAIGGDQGQHQGIDRLADYLNRDLAGEVVYDHWLGWELAFYLGETPQVTPRYVSLPEALADDVAQSPHETRYLLAPSAEEAAFWLEILAGAGIAAETIYVDNFMVYRLTPALYSR